MHLGKIEVNQVLTNFRMPTNVQHIAVDNENTDTTADNETRTLQQKLR